MSEQLTATARPALLRILQSLPSSDYQYATTIAFHAAHKLIRDDAESFRKVFGTAGEYAIKAIMEETSGKVEVGS